MAISGSPGSPSKSRALADLALRVLTERGAEGRLIDLAALPAEALLGRAQSPELEEATSAVGESDVLIAATPTYRALYTGLLKCFFDLMPPAYLAGKRCIGLQTGIAAEHALSPEYGLRPLFASLDCITSAVLYARDDEFENGVPGEALTERVRSVLLSY